MSRSIIGSMFVVSLLTVGCSRTAPAPPPPAPIVSTIPAAFFTAERPAVAPDLADVRAGAAVGDDVTFLARVGGRGASFVDGLAMFVCADPELVSCELMPEDHCAKPWDYCCEDPDELSAGLATVRLLDPAGKEIRADVRGAGGLEELKYVVVEGTVSTAGEDAGFVVDAKRIWVGGKPERGAARKGSGAESAG